MTKKFIFCAPLLLTLAACPGTRTGNPPAAVTALTFTASTQSATVAQSFSLWDSLIPGAWAALSLPSLTDATGAEVTLEQAWIVVEEIEFKAEESGDSGSDDASLKFKGPYVADLLASPAPLDEQTVALGTYKRIKMQLHELESLPSGAPAALSRKSLYLEGRVGGRPFTYASKDGTEFEVGGPHGITLNSGDDLLVVFRFAQMFKKMDLSSVTTNTDISEDQRVAVTNPCAQIDPSAEDLYTCFRKGFESEANFGKDSGSHDLDGDSEKVKD